MLPIVLALAFLFALWSSERRERATADWSIGDWAGAVLLAFGAIFAISGFAEPSLAGVVRRHDALQAPVVRSWATGRSARSRSASASSRSSPGSPRSFRLPRRAADARAAHGPLGRRSPGFIGFGLYTALKAAYLSTQFATRVEERNLIYVAPLLFVGTALVLERRRVNIWALAAAAAYALYLVGYALYHVVGSPYEMGVQLYSDSLGFSILQQANRYIALDTTTRAVVLDRRPRRRRRARCSRRCCSRDAARLAAALAGGARGPDPRLERHRRDRSRRRQRSRSAAARASTLRHPFTLDRRGHGRKPDAVHGPGRDRPESRRSSSSSGTGRS